LRRCGTLGVGFFGVGELAKQVDGYASVAKDAARVRMMSSEIKRLAAASK
jgi:hypothetical protein